MLVSSQAGKASAQSGQRGPQRPVRLRKALLWHCPGIKEVLPSVVARGRVLESWSVESGRAARLEGQAQSPESAG